MPTPITIYSISRDTADADGGQLLEIQGDFAGEFGKEYQIHVGPIGSYTDPACYSGQPGHPRVLYPLNERKLRGYLPPLPVGGPYDLFVRRVDMTRTVLVASVITVMPAMHYSGVFGLRIVLPTYYRTGPRSMEALGPA
jgi:hypothetical protein